MEEKHFCRVCDSTRHVDEWRLKNGEPVYLCVDCWQRGYLKGLLVERVKRGDNQQKQSKAWEAGR